MNSSKEYWISTNEAISVPTKTILNEYLFSLKRENKTEATISKYRSLLERFFRECTIPIDELMSDDVLKWFRVFSDGKRVKTVELMHSTLSTFFKFCIAKDYLDIVITKNPWRQKIPLYLPKYLNEQEYVRVLLASEQLPLRDRVLVHFLFSSGCRRYEVTQLTIQDVDLDNRTARVEGKGKKSRTIHFSRECGLLLKAYLRTRFDDQTEPLFQTKFNNSLGESGIYKIIKKLGELANLKQTLHPQVCRNTFTNMLARDTDLEFIPDETSNNYLNIKHFFARISKEEMLMTYQNAMG
ncbi:tyrosine-type recombinase/integrase [Psychrobacillus sp. FSL H8-0487]|uniref:tyrosine-type recombinase/integrase n=1 Tax=Psychrobacillus sp. FSL H8-0487 TaxID=2921391 RepID=UPI0030F66685